MMRTILLCILFSVFISTGITSCQVPERDIPQLLESLYNRLVDNYNDNDRIRINDSIKMILGSYVKSDSVFAHRFSNLRYLGQITSPDSVIKIITWNLVLENEPGNYLCYIIKRDGYGKENTIYTLSAKYNITKIRTDTTYTELNWYGALYYDLKPYFSNNKHSWVMLGIDYGNPNISRKIIEVLSFNDDGSIVLGRKWFVSGRTKQYREVFEYASNAMMSLRFRTDSCIVFDHLVPFSPSFKDNRQYYGPDYSFDAFNFCDGLWKITIGVDVRNQ